MRNMARRRLTEQNGSEPLRIAAYRCVSLRSCAWM